MAASAQRVPLTAYMTGRRSEQHGSEDGLRSERHPTLFPGDPEGVCAGRGRYPDVSVERFAGQGSPTGEDDGTSAPLSHDTTAMGVSAYLEKMGASPDTLEIIQTKGLTGRHLIGVCSGEFSRRVMVEGLLITDEVTIAMILSDVEAAKKTTKDQAVKLQLQLRVPRVEDVPQLIDGSMIPGRPDSVKSMPPVPSEWHTYGQQLTGMMELYGSEYLRLKT